VVQRIADSVCTCTGVGSAWASRKPGSMSTRTGSRRAAYSA